MSELGYHLCFRLRNDAVIASTIQERRVLARVVLDQGRGRGLYAFGYPDTHVHLAARVDRAEAGRLLHGVEVSLKRRLGLGTGFVAHDPIPLRDNHHLYNTVRYVLRQGERHGVDVDPGREASNVPDLLGLRVLGGYTRTNLRRWLPRLQTADFLEALGASSLAPSEGEVDDVIPAALAAGCRAELSGASREVVALRRAIVDVIGDRRTCREMAALFGQTRRNVELLRTRPVDEQLARAIRLQLDLGRHSAP